jgi:hypothetical protein
VSGMAHLDPSGIMEIAAGYWRSNSTAAVAYK